MHGDFLPVSSVAEESRKLLRKTAGKANDSTLFCCAPGSSGRPWHSSAKVILIFISMIAAYLVPVSQTACQKTSCRCCAGRANLFEHTRKREHETLPPSATQLLVMLALSLDALPELRRASNPCKSRLKRGPIDPLGPRPRQGALEEVDQHLGNCFVEVGAKWGQSVSGYPVWRASRLKQSRWLLNRHGGSAQCPGARS